MFPVYTHESPSSSLEESTTDQRSLAQDYHVENSRICEVTDAINKAAIVHLPRAEYNEAIEILTSALSLLSDTVRANGEQETSFRRKPLQNPVLHFSSSQSSELFVGSCSQVRHGIQKVFQSPICVTNGSDLLPGTDTFVILSFVVIYNLALSWHLKAVSHTTQNHSRTSMHRKALNLYEFASKIMANGGISGDPLPYMAVVSNMGALCLDLGCAERSRACQSALLSTILCCVDSRYTTSNWERLLDGFLWNASQGVFETIASPAA